MLNVRMNGKEGSYDLEISGNIVEITADVSMLIKLIYGRLDGVNGAFFANGIKHFMQDGAYKMSAEEMDKHNQEKEKPQKKDLAKLVKELLGGFNKLDEEE